MGKVSGPPALAQCLLTGHSQITWVHWNGMVPCGLTKVESLKRQCSSLETLSSCGSVWAGTRINFGTCWHRAQLFGFFYFKKNFGHAAQYVGILILKPGINLCPLHLKLGVLTTGPPEKSQESKSLAILVQRLWRTGNWPLFLST